MANWASSTGSSACRTRFNGWTSLCSILFLRSPCHYLVYILLLFGTADAARFLVAIYFVLLWISIFNMALAFVMFNRSIGFFGLGASLIFPLYQGVYLKC